MPDKKFSPAKQVVKMRNLSVSFSLNEYEYIKRVAKARKLSTRGLIRQATVFALDHLEKKDG